MLSSIDLLKNFFFFYLLLFDLSLHFDTFHCLNLCSRLVDESLIHCLNRNWCTLFLWKEQKWHQKRRINEMSLGIDILLPSSTRLNKVSFKFLKLPNRVSRVYKIWNVVAMRGWENQQKQISFSLVIQREIYLCIDWIRNNNSCKGIMRFQRMLSITCNK